MKYRILFISKDMVFKKALSTILQKKFDADVFIAGEIDENILKQCNLVGPDFMMIDMDFATNLILS